MPTASVNGRLWTTRPKCVDLEGMDTRLFTVWRGNALIDNVSLAGLLSTDKLQDQGDGLWYPATAFFQFAPAPPPLPTPQASFEVCYQAPGGGITCARANGPGPAIFGAALLGLVVGVAVGVKLA